LADSCDVAPCVQVNHRFVRTTTPETFDALVTELREGKREHDIPAGTLIAFAAAADYTRPRPRLSWNAKRPSRARQA